MQPYDHLQHRAEDPEDRLARWASATVSDLRDAFLGADATTDLAALEGHPQCRGLALDGLLAGRDARLRKRAGGPSFPWNGKSFRLTSSTSGWGYNRLNGAGLIAALPFGVSVAPSVWDGRGSVRIDYSTHERSPRYQRRFLDELREVENGLFIGPAGWRTSGGMRPFAWFAVDTNKEVSGVAI